MYKIETEKGRFPVTTDAVLRAYYAQNAPQEKILRRIGQYVRVVAVGARRGRGVGSTMRDAC
jgi:hypothetical protein